MNGRESISRLLMIAGIAGAFFMGYKAASSSDRDQSGGDFDRDSTQRSEASAGEGEKPDAVGGSEAGRIGEGRAWQEVREQVVKRWNASPSVTVDFDLREETMRMLEKSPITDLEAWLRELLPDRDVDGEMNIPLQLREMILMVLIQRDPGRVIHSLVEHPLGEFGGFYMDEAMEHWIKNDPIAVLDWLEGNVPKVMKNDIDHYREDALVHLAGKNPAEFERRLSKLDSDTREWVLEWYAYLRESGEERAEILARAAGSPYGDSMALWEGLLEREGLNDPKRAYATLKELEVSADDRATLDQELVSWLLLDHDTDTINRCGVMQEWVERNPGALVPDRILKSFDKWSESDRDRAIAWIAEQPSGPQYDTFAQLMIKQRPGEHEAIAKMASRISDESLRVTVLRQLKTSWQAKDSAAAAEWEKKLSENDRERLK